MNHHFYISPGLAVLLIGVVSALRIDGADQAGGELPEFDASTAAKGLELRCEPVAGKTNFVLGETIELLCILTNTTDEIKPVAWHTTAGDRFTLVRGETNWFGGLLPRVQPQLREEIKVRPRNGTPGHLFFLPAHSSINLLLTYEGVRPESFRGRVVYDPVAHGGGFFGEEDMEKYRQMCAFSNVFEYQVLSANEE